MIRLPRIPKTLKNKRVLVRVDFNVPSRLGKVQDDFRIKKTIPTIKELQNRRNSVILLTHFEVGGDVPSLLHIASYLRRHGFPKLRFVGDVVGEKAQRAASTMKQGEVILLENVRKDAREKKNPASFAKELASLADVFVNEAFSASHREHASIVGVPRHIPSYAGPLFVLEVKHLNRALRPKKPFLFIIGGNKFSTKAKLVSKFLRKSNNIFIGGSLSNTFLFVNGYTVGKSEIERDMIGIIRKKFSKSSKIITPTDVVVRRSGKKETVQIDELQQKDIIYDVGEDSVRMLEPFIKNARFILWNGPIGFIEGGYTSGTKQLANLLAASKAEVIVGGGDTVAYLDKLKLTDEFSFVSTGGGAMLDFLANKTLPGIEALIKQ